MQIVDELMTPIHQRFAQRVIAMQIVDELVFRSLRRHPPPERAQHFSLHSEGIRLLSEGEVVERAQHNINLLILSRSGMASDTNISTIY